MAKFLLKQKHLKTFLIADNWIRDGNANINTESLMENVSDSIESLRRLFGNRIYSKINRFKNLKHVQLEIQNLCDQSFLPLLECSNLESIDMLIWSTCTLTDV